MPWSLSVSVIVVCIKSWPAFAVPTNLGNYQDTELLLAARNTKLVVLHTPCDTVHQYITIPMASTHQGHQSYNRSDETT